ncbi:MAG: VPDSG-CTERM sorting domain-containing protein, partial [Kiritimatiellia bacterium]
MKMYLRQLRMSGGVVALMAMAGLAQAIPVQFDFTAANYGEGNKGEAWRPPNAVFEITARWGLSDNDNTGTGSYDPKQNPDNGLDASGNPLTGPTPGLVYQDADGLGVWAEKYKLGKTGLVLDGGSAAISGGGPHGNEELIFTFDYDVLLDSITVGLVQIDMSGKKGDDPIFFITGSYGSEIGIPESTLFSIFNDTGNKSGYVNFNDLTLFSNPNETVRYFRTRELSSHYEVAFLRHETSSGSVPDGGATAGLLGLALFGLGGLKRKL